MSFSLGSDPLKDKLHSPFGRVKLYNAVKPSPLLCFFRYDSTLDTLSSLQLVGSYTEVRNYIAMTTVILSRLYVESRNTSSCALWSQIQDVLISSACRVPFTDQVCSWAGQCSPCKPGQQQTSESCLLSKGSCTYNPGRKGDEAHRMLGSWECFCFRMEAVIQGDCRYG